MTFTVGISALTKLAMPEMRPPPPTATNTAARSRWLWRRISSPTVPCPAITSGSSKGWISVAPLSRCSSSQRSLASE
jgi:hypothetical protein